MEIENSHKIINPNNLAQSAELFDVSKSIGDQFGLNLDQIGELDTQVRWVLRGKASSKTFSEDIARLLEINKDVADTVTAAVNNKFFEYFKVDMSDNQSAQNVSAIEQAGDFEIERPAAPAQMPNRLNMLDNSTPEQKTDIISGIENPIPTPPRAAQPINPPAVPIPTRQPEQYAKKEPLVEQLLRGTVAMPEQRFEQSIPQPQQQPPKPAPQKTANTDPYREPIN